MIGKTWSRLLTAYYRGPDHPLKLRLWRYMRQSMGYAPLTVAYGQRGWITIDERDWLQSAIFSSGSYEPEVWAALAAYATTDEVVWDVGAHIGSFTLRAAQDCRVKTVCAFEPDPLTFEILRRNLALNGDPGKPYRLALSDMTEDRMLIHGPTTNTGMSTLLPTSSTGMIDHLSDGRAEVRTFDVACCTVDELIATGAAPAPTLLKIDVEGWEYHVLNGAHDLLRSAKLKAMVIETASDPTGRLVDDGLAALLEQHRYTIQRIRRPGGEVRGVENYLAAHV